MLFALTLRATPPQRLGLSFDTGYDPVRAISVVDAQSLKPAPPGSWLRIRGLDAWPIHTGDAAKSTREALTRLRGDGYRLVAMIRWPTDSWCGGVRDPNRPGRLPIDLRDAFDRDRQLATIYGDLIDYWEIDDEPDISYVPENPETYTAFLKACYLGVTEGNAENLYRANRDLSQAETLKSSAPRITNNPAPITTRAACHVLMGALALPPGPYWEAFVRNGGLSYTDGFNYHYYGYAEDFTGVYHQFEAAVSEFAGAPAEAQSNDKGGSELGQPNSKFPIPNYTAADPAAVWSTNIYPGVQGWSGDATAGFDYPEHAIHHELELALARPRAREEPIMTQQGRWLVSDGVTVQEEGNTWRFTVTRLPAGPIRAPMVELPLPANWHWPADSYLMVDYRAAPVGSAQTRAATDTIDVAQVAAGAARRAASAAPIGALYPDSRSNDAARSALHQRPANPARVADVASDHAANRAQQRAQGPTRELPVFLTEYGYGLLDEVTRNTAEGRERQRAWFAVVREEVRKLGIEGAMCFVLMPYLENDLMEYGLLATAPTKRPDDKTTSGNAAADGTPPRATDGKTPALKEIMATAVQPLQPRRWKVSTPRPSPIVIDFIGGAQLLEAKSFDGYFLGNSASESAPAEARLVIYNFGDSEVAGELRLDGDAWRLASTAGRSASDHAAILTLSPGERRVMTVAIAPHGDRFVGSAISASFCPLTGADLAEAKAKIGELRPLATAPNPSAPNPSVGERPPNATAPQSPAPPPPLFPRLECYFRTANGNLYQTWPRLWPTATWKQYMEPEADFTMTFWGRAALPWRFRDNRPVSLVVFFHSQQYPAVFEVRAARMVRFSRVSGAR